MKKIRKAVILVAGMGTRFLPITKSIPKEMLPIVDRPTLDYIVDEVIESGIEEILLITSPYKKSIEDFYDEHYELESRLEKSGKVEQLELVKNISKKANIFYRRQGAPLGTGHAVSLAKSFVGNEPFAVLYPDDLIRAEVPVLKQLIDVYDKYDCNVIGVQQVDINDVNKYGIMIYEDIESGKIKGLIEKPNIDDTPSTSAGLGRYIFKPEIFDELSKISKVNGEYLLTDAMLNLMQTQDFYDCKFKGDHYDIGNPLGYLKANIGFGLNRDDLKEGLTEYIASKNK